MTEDFEILVRRWGPTQYAAYCPQLKIMVKGSSHEEVERLLQEKIRSYLSAQNSSAEDIPSRSHHLPSSKKDNGPLEENES